MLKLSISWISYRHAASNDYLIVRFQRTSIVTENIFENHFKYVDELTRMGANIKVESNTAIIEE